MIFILESDTGTNNYQDSDNFKIRIYVKNTHYIFFSWVVSCI
jgi:hypothetical protein